MRDDGASRWDDHRGRTDVRIETAARCSEQVDGNLLQLGIVLAQGLHAGLDVVQRDGVGVIVPLVADRRRAKRRGVEHGRRGPLFVGPQDAILANFGRDHFGVEIVGVEPRIALVHRLFDGLIDEVRIWSTVRTATEISNYRYIQIDSATNLQASWHLNNSLVDSSGNSNTLTNNNGSIATIASTPANAVNLTAQSILNSGEIQADTPLLDVTRTLPTEGFFFSKGGSNEV